MLSLSAVACQQSHETINQSINKLIMTPVNLLLAMTGEMQWLRLQTQSAKFGFETTENIEDFGNVQKRQIPLEIYRNNCPSNWGGMALEMGYYIL